MNITRRTAIVGAVATLGLAGPALTAAGAATTHAAAASPVVGHVYVNGNTVTANTVVAFNRHADGSLTPEHGSPFAAGGAGTGAGTGSQGTLEASSNGRFLLAADAGSNQVSVLAVAKSGALTRVAGGTVSSHGTKPVSIAVTPWGNKDLVYVANAGAGTTDSGGSYTGFVLSARGHLDHLAGSTVAVPDGSSLGDAFFNPTGTTLAGTRVGTALIDSFNVGRNGLLYPAAGSPYASQGPGPIGSEFSPTKPNQLFVSNAHGGPNAGTVSAFTVSRGGALSSIGAGPYADHQTAPCWVEISHDGKYLFTANTAVPSISRYKIAENGSLTLLGSTALNATTEAGPVDLRLSPNGKTLYVVDGGSATISAFSVHRGDLAALSSKPTALPTGTSPVGIVVD